ncbi:MAG: cytochrome c maturation protein CcmE [Alphaproteobacteria bacterium]
MKKQHHRLYFILFLLSMVGLAVGLVLYGLRDGVSYFYSPSDIASGKSLHLSKFRLGGVVKKQSIKKTEDGIFFVVTDFVHDTDVMYKGLLPNLFRENSGVIALGQFDKKNNMFMASDILAKHDENYMPKEVVKALKDSGTWRE